jgi:glycosyltransferase involved in cell wall biosynthesis
MKILQVSSATTIGGGEVHVMDLCRALLERGHQVHLAVRPHSPLVDRLAPHPVAVHALPLRNSLDIASARRMSGIIEHHQIDLIHGHLARDYLVCAIAQRLAKRTQLVLTRHHYLPLKNNWGYRRVVRRVGKIIAVSECVRRGLIASLGLSPNQVVTIPNWINLDEYQAWPDGDRARAQFGVRRRYVIGMIGQITPAKGQQEFIRAAALIASSRDDVEFLIVGEEQNTDRPFAERLRRLTHELKLSDHVKFLGRVDDVSRLLAALTILVVPSWHEAFSIALIQAMAAGVPVVASNVGGPAEIITDGVTGLLVPPRQVDALAQAVNCLLDDPDLRAHLSLAGHREVEVRFEREKVINQIEAVYQAVVGRS